MKRIAALLDFSLDRTGKKYASEDPKLLEHRVLNALQVEVLAGLTAGERVIISDYDGLERVERVDLTR